MGVMRTMTAEHGDLEVKWDADNEEEVEQARSTFEAMKEQQYTAYRMEDGSRGEQIKEFDPEAEAILLVPRMVGG